MPANSIHSCYIISIDVVGQVFVSEEDNKSNTSTHGPLLFQKASTHGTTHRLGVTRPSQGQVGLNATVPCTQATSVACVLHGKTFSRMRL